MLRRKTSLYWSAIYNSGLSLWLMTLFFCCHSFIRFFCLQIFQYSMWPWVCLVFVDASRTNCVSVHCWNGAIAFLNHFKESSGFHNNFFCFFRWFFMEKIKLNGFKFDVRLDITLRFNSCDKIFLIVCCHNFSNNYKMPFSCRKNITQRWNKITNWIKKRWTAMTLASASFCSVCVYMNKWDPFQVYLVINKPINRWRPRKQETINTTNWAKIATSASSVYCVWWLSVHWIKLVSHFCWSKE